MRGSALGYACHKMRSLVLDRSYLQAMPGESISSLCERYRVIMTEALFFELLTAGKATMHALFAKFPECENPVVVVGHVGHLMAQEVDTNEPSSPADRLVLFNRFTFNPALAAGTYEFTADQRTALADWEKHQRESEAGFLERYRTIHRIFPQLASYKAGQGSQPLLDAQKQVATDVILMGRAYEHYRPSRFPTTAAVGPAWAVYRWIQVQLLYALEYLRRYGPDRPEEVGQRLANDVLDAQYVVTGVLADALATGDEQVSAFFSLLKPSSELLSP